MIRRKRSFVESKPNSLRSKASDAYDKLLDAADLAFQLHENIDDEELSDDWYNLCFSIRELADTVYITCTTYV